MRHTGHLPGVRSVRHRRGVPALGSGSRVVCVGACRACAGPHRSIDQQRPGPGVQDSPCCSDNVTCDQGPCCIGAVVSASTHVRALAMHVTDRRPTAVARARPRKSQIATGRLQAIRSHACCRRSWSTGARTARSWLCAALACMHRRHWLAPAPHQIDLSASA